MAQPTTAVLPPPGRRDRFALSWSRHRALGEGQMTELSNIDRARKYYTRSRPFFAELAGALVPDRDADTAVEDGLARYEQMLPDLAYVDRPDAAMADSLFWCSAALAL